MEKKTASIIGIILGIAIIIVGFCVQGISVDAGGHEDYGTPTIGSNIKFGADFYTEIYAVTQDVGDAVNSANMNIHGAVNNAQRNICGAIEKVCDAIGWLIVAIGLFDIAYFVCKKASCEENYSRNNYYAVQTATATTYTTQSQAVPPSSLVPNSSPVSDAKAEVILEKETRDAGNVAEPTKPKKEKTLAEKLEYALRYSTDDGMIRYLKGVDDALVANILKEPEHLIRGLVETALQEMQ